MGVVVIDIMGRSMGCFPVRSVVGTIGSGRQVVEHGSENCWGFTTIGDDRMDLRVGLNIF